MLSCCFLTESSKGLSQFNWIRQPLCGRTSKELCTSQSKPAEPNSAVSPDLALRPSSGVNVPSLPGPLGSTSLCIPKPLVENCLGEAESMAAMDSNLLTLL